MRMIFKHLQKALQTLLITSIFLFSTIAGPLTQNTSAINTKYPVPNSNNDFDETELKDIENITTFIDKCLGGNDLASGFTSEAAENGDIFDNNASYTVSAYVDKDHVRFCKAQAKTIITKLYGGMKAFIDTYYIKGGNPACGDPSRWYFKSDAKECNDDRSEDVFADQRKVESDARSKAKSKGYYFKPYKGSGLPPEYAYNVLRPEFTKCFQRLTEDNIRDPDATIQGIDWLYKNGNQGDIYIGYLLASTGDDGRLNCQELGQYINNDSNQVGFVVLTDEEIKKQIVDETEAGDTEKKKEDLIELFYKQENVGGVIIDNKEFFKECMKGTPFESMSVDQSIPIVANWLASGGEGEIKFNTNPNGSGAGTTVPADVAAFIRGCLESKISGTEEIVNRAPTDPSLPDGPIDPNGAGQSDDCLANTDQFFGWFACPVINAIDSVMEKIEDIIKSLLKFDLETQNKDNGLKDAWNIFRSLATILIMIGFLLALLVKGIKGE